MARATAHRGRHDGSLVDPEWIVREAGERGRVTVVREAWAVSPERTWDAVEHA